MRQKCKSADRLRAAITVGLGGLLAINTTQALAASASWNAAATDGNWVTTSSENNWSTGAGTYPGSTTNTTDSDTATFNVASNVYSINVNDPLYIGSINFDASASPYTISGDSLYLASGGSISLLSTLTVNNENETISAPLVLDGNYSFLNNATTTGTNSADLLKITGNVSAGVAGTTTLTLGGGNLGANLISGNISDGSGQVAILKSGTGLWELSGSNSFSGAITITGGGLQIENASALGNTSGVVISGSAELQLANNIYVSGVNVTLNGTGGAYDSYGPLKATGSGTTTWAGNVLLGVDQARFGTTSTTPTATFDISGVISSGTHTYGPAIRVPNTGGIIEFSGANTYLGNTSIVVGTLEMGATNTLPATTTVVFGNNSSQGYATLDLDGYNQTIAGIAFTTGDNIPTIVTASSAATLTINDSSALSFGNATTGLLTGALALTKAGSGTLTLQNAPSDTYTGPTTLLGGTLALDASTYANSSSTTVGNLISNSSLVLSGGALTLKGRANGTATSLSGASYGTSSTTITVSSTSGLVPGQPFSGPGLPSGEYVVDIASSTTFVASATPTAAETGQTLTVTPTSNATVQTFNGTTLATGLQTVTLNVNGGTSTTLGFGAINRQIGSTIDFTIPSGGNFTTTTPNASFPGGQATILGGYATVGGSTWAVSGGNGSSAGSITGLASYTSGFASAADVDAVPSSSGTSVGAMTINSLRFNTVPGTGTSYTINPTGLLTIATGGILVTGNVGANQVTVNGGGSLTSGNGQDLIFILNNSANDVFDSPIVDDGSTSIGVTRSGTGAALYVVNAQSTYTGPTTLDSGVTVAQSNSTVTNGNLVSGPYGVGSLIFDGGQMRATSNNPTVIANNVTLDADVTFVNGSTYSLTFTGPVTLANGTRTLTSSSAGTVVFSGTIGDNGLDYGINKAGTGTIIFNASNTYNGPTNINAGPLIANANYSATGNGVVNVNSTGVLAGVGYITGPVTVAGGATISAGTGATSSNTPGNLTAAGGNGSTTFSQAWVGASTSATAGTYAVKFNAANLGSSGATIGGSNPTATRDPGGPGNNWDVLTMNTLNLVATSTNQFNITTLVGTANTNSGSSTFNASGTYSWPVAIINQGIGGFYINGSPAVPSTSQTQAALLAAIAPLLRLNAAGLETATGVSNASSFSIGVAPDPYSSGSGEDIVINYSPAPEPTTLATLALAAGALTLRRRRARSAPTASV